MLLLQGVHVDTSPFPLPGAEKLQKNLTSPRGDTHRPERVSCWRYGRALAFEMISCGKEEGSMRWNMGAFFCDGEREKLSLDETQTSVQRFAKHASAASEGDGVLTFTIEDAQMGL